VASGPARGVVGGGGGGGAVMVVAEMEGGSWESATVMARTSFRSGRRGRFPGDGAGSRRAVRGPNGREARQGLSRAGRSPIRFFWGRERRADPGAVERAEVAFGLGLVMGERVRGLASIHCGVMRGGAGWLLGSRPRPAARAAFRYPYGTMNLELTLVFRKVPEGYIGFVEELPGANSQGETLDEVRTNLEEAVMLVLEANRALAEQEIGGAEVIRETITAST
jgi:predicted RNase H-like HicB family nuclease